MFSDFFKSSYKIIHNILISDGVRLNVKDSYSDLESGTITLDRANEKAEEE